MSMNFRPHRSTEPEINLIPFIDVLLVILIFLMLSTTYSKFNEMQITLPTADAQAMPNRPKEIILSVAADGRYAVNRQPVDGRSVDVLSEALRQAAGGDVQGADAPTLILNADATATHQSVMSAMEAARRVGLARIGFASQAPTR